MTIYFSRGGKDLALGMQDFLEAIATTLSQFPSVQKVLAVPPDHTRMDSQAGPIMHRFRTEVDTLGYVESDFVSEVTEGHYDRPWPAQVNQMCCILRHKFGSGVLICA